MTHTDTYYFTVGYLTETQCEIKYNRKKQRRVSVHAAIIYTLCNCCFGASKLTSFFKHYQLTPTCYGGNEDFIIYIGFRNIYNPEVCIIDDIMCLYVSVCMSQIVV